MNTSKTIESKILRSIWSTKNPLPIVPKDYEQLAKPAAIRQALARLVKAGKLRRIRRGLYERPRAHSIMGLTPSDPLAVAETMMRARQAPWQVSGAYAANLLGLTEQVPTQLIVNTSASVASVNLGNAKIRFRRVAPSSLLGAGRPAGMVIQAIRYLGPNSVGPTVTGQLRKQLDPATKTELAKITPELPRWMQPVMQEITATTATP